MTWKIVKERKEQPSRNEHPPDLRGLGHEDFFRDSPWICALVLKNVLPENEENFFRQHFSLQFELRPDSDRHFVFFKSKVGECPKKQALYLFLFALQMLELKPELELFLISIPLLATYMQHHLVHNTSKHPPKMHLFAAEKTFKHIEQVYGSEWRQFEGKKDLKHTGPATLPDANLGSLFIEPRVQMFLKWSNCHLENSLQAHHLLARQAGGILEILEKETHAQATLQNTVQNTVQKKAA